MRTRNIKDSLIDFGAEILGSLIAAFAFYNFAVQAEFPMTGFSCIALIF